MAWIMQSVRGIYLTFAVKQNKETAVKRLTEVNVFEQNCAIK